MEEAKILGQLGAFGIIGLIICLFIGCTICLCLTVHVKFIYTFLCPIQNLQSCCRLFANKFRASHKPTPNSILDLEKQISGSKRALKIARRVNQSQLLKDFHHITPRLNSFIVDLQQESSRQVVYKRSSDQILLPSVKTAEPKGPKTGSPFEAAGSHLVELHPPPIEKPIVSAAKLSQSLFLEPTSRNTQTDFSLVSDTELLRVRTGSVDQLTTREPFPRIKLVKEAGKTCERY